MVCGLAVCPAEFTVSPDAGRWHGVTSTVSLPNVDPDVRLDALLNAHAYLRIERPPVLWEADIADTMLIPLLGEALVQLLVGGASLHEITLSAANVSVTEEARGSLAPGDYVSLTVSGLADLGGDARWPDDPRFGGLSADLVDRLVASGVVHAYARQIGATGSITLFIPRLPEKS